MIMNIYALRDRVAGQFRSVTLDEKDEVSKRNLSFSVNNNPQLAFMSKDLELCCIGSMDTDNGVIKPEIPIRLIVRADQLLGADEVVKNEV